MKNTINRETAPGNGSGSTDQRLDPICAHQQFERLAATAPDRIAVTSSQGTLTYGELNARGNQLACRLQAFGIGPETVVALCVPRSAAMLVGALGILKSGGAYLPI